MMTRRHFLTASVACFECASAGIAQAQYQTYPTRPVTMIVPLGAGSVSDLVARVVADRMAKSLGQPIIIENVSGADGKVGTRDAQWLYDPLRLCQRDGAERRVLFASLRRVERFRADFSRDQVFVGSLCEEDDAGE